MSNYPNDTAPFRQTVIIFSQEQKKRYEKDALRLHLLCVAFSCAQILNYLVYFLNIGGSYDDFAVRLILITAPVVILSVAGIIMKRPVSAELLMVLVCMNLEATMFYMHYFRIDVQVWMMFPFLIMVLIGGWLFSEVLLFRFYYRKTSPADEFKPKKYHIDVKRIDLEDPDDEKKNSYLSKRYHVLLLATGLLNPVNLVPAVAGLITKKIVLPRASRIWAIVNAAAIGAQLVYINTAGAQKEYNNPPDSVAPYFLIFVGLLFRNTAVIAFLICAAAAAFTAWKYKPDITRS